MMAEVEWEHEHYFRLKVLSHWLGRLLPIWPEPPQKSDVRMSFAAEFDVLINRTTCV
jgi:hypothetical protein